MMLAPGGLVDECVRTEFGSYVEELDVTGRYSGASLATADYECEHGRLAGDPCPSPTIVASQAWPNLGLRKGDVVQNWPHRFPCGCFAHEPAPAYIDLTPKEPLMLTPARLAVEVPEAPDADDILAAAITAAAGIVPAHLVDIDALIDELAAMDPRAADFERLVEVNRLVKTRFREHPRRAELDDHIKRLVFTGPAPAAKLVTRVAHITSDTLLGRMVGELDDKIAERQAEIAELAAFRDAIVEVLG